MSQISHIFRKMMPQVLHILVLPLFFFAFMLLYRPFHADQLLGNDMYGVHVTIISCIVLLCVAICRLLYYFIPMYLNYSLYVTWCFGEMTTLHLACSRTLSSLLSIPRAISSDGCSDLGNPIFHPWRVDEVV